MTAAIAYIVCRRCRCRRLHALRIVQETPVLVAEARCVICGLFGTKVEKEKEPALMADSS